MIYRAFALGLFAITGQVLLLRVLVSSLNGNDLFIGIALFSWLIAVAVGAYIGGRRPGLLKCRTLFIIGVILLPVILVLVKLSPIWITSVAGEYIPFTSAVVVSLLAMIPIGIISGWLFPVISQDEVRTRRSIVYVYLWEGIGAFVGGLVLVSLTVGILSTLQISIIMGMLTLLFCLIALRSYSYCYTIVNTSILIILSVSLLFLFDWVDKISDNKLFPGYEIMASIDTHYGHQAILSRDSSFVLVTDNNIEGVSSDLVTAENLLIPPLLYNPKINDVLYVGRSEFGIGDIAYQFNNLNFAAIDPRVILTEKLNELKISDPVSNRKHDDPIVYFSDLVHEDLYDLIIINSGNIESYKNCRYLTESFFRKCKFLLRDSGILFIPSFYDTDRYLQPGAGEILSVINNTLKNVFKVTRAWSGDMTLLFASDRQLPELSIDSITSVIGELEYKPYYISEYYLGDRLNEIHQERIKSALTNSDQINSINRPILSHLQTKHKARASRWDLLIVETILNKSLWVVIPIIVIGFLFAGIKIKPVYRFFGVVLYFVAGLVSLSMELLVFYLYQSTAGSLYTEMAVLIGTFMLGLSVGTFLSHRYYSESTPILSLLTMLMSIGFYYLTWDNINVDSSLLYHLGFMFVMALATGSMFTSGTELYYWLNRNKNRGIGYAFELSGSAIGSLLTITILLPLIGLQGILISFIIILLLATIGWFFIDKG